MQAEQIMQKGISAGYNVDLARKFGINEAIILNRLIFLHQNNRRKDGYTWQTAKDWEAHTGLSAYQVRKALNHLEDEGILELKNTYIIGTQTKCKHQRFVLQSDCEESELPDCKETAQSESKETAQSVNSIEHSIEHSIIDSNESMAKRPEYGNDDINRQFEKFEKMFGYKMKQTKYNRRAVWNFLRAKDKGEQWLDGMMKIWLASRSDRYSPRISDFADLQDKHDKLMEWGQRKHINTNIKRITREDITL